MAKCPHCKAEIDHLNLFETKHYDAEVGLVDGKLVHSNEGVYVETTSYDCPECDKEVCEDGSCALELLKGGE